MDIFQNNRFRTSLRNLGNTTQNLGRVMRNDARIRKADYEEITRLNDRLKRVIPIIPASFGMSGATLGSGLDDGGGGFGFPGFFGGFGPFGGLPGGPGRGGGGGGGGVTNPFTIPIAFPGYRDVRVPETIPVQQPVQQPVITTPGTPGVEVPGTGTTEEDTEVDTPLEDDGFRFPNLNPFPYIIPLIKPLFEPALATASSTFQNVKSGQFMVDMVRGLVGEEGYKKLETEFAKMPDQLAAQQEQQQKAGLLNNLTDPNFIMQSIALQQSLGGLGQPGTDTFGDFAMQAGLASRLSRAFKFKGQSTPFATPLPKDYFLRGQTSILKGDYFSSNPLMRKKLERMFQDPSFDDFPQLPGTAFGTEPLFPSTIKSSGPRKSTSSTIDPTVVDDVPQNLKGVGGKHSKGTGVTEEVVTTTGEPTSLSQFEDAIESITPDVLRQLQEQLERTSPGATRTELERIINANTKNKSSIPLLPPPNKDLGLQSSAKVRIKPIYILTDRIA